jgi:hypothetical protein
VAVAVSVPDFDTVGVLDVVLGARMYTTLLLPPVR